MRSLIEGAGRIRWYTHLGPLFDALGDLAHPARWLITNWELNVYGPEFPFDPSTPPRLVEDAALHAFVARCEPQFIWGVLSALPPGVAVDPLALTTEPWADGNPDLWNPDLPVQLPGARYEIVCWDSTCTIVTSDLLEVHRRVRAAYPEAHAMPPPRGGTLPGAGAPA